MCDCHNNLKLNPDILNESMELDRTIYFSLSSLLINKNIKFENNKTPEFSLRKTTMPGIIQFNENEDSENNNKFMNNIKSFSEIFERVNSERKNFRNIVVSFLRNRFWKITNSKKNQKFFVNKIKGINVQIQLKKITKLESKIDDLNRKIHIIIKKNNQLQEKFSKLKKELDNKKEEFKNLLKQDKPSDLKKSCFLEEDSSLLEKSRISKKKKIEKSFQNSKIPNKRISYKNRTLDRKMSARGSLKPKINRNSVVNLNSINDLNNNIVFNTNRDAFDLVPDLEGIKDVNVYEKKKKRRKKKSRKYSDLRNSHFQ